MRLKYEKNYINNKLQNIVNDDLVSFHMPGHKKGKIYELYCFCHIYLNIVLS